MTGTFYINGINATTSYGIAMTEESAESLVQFPALAKPEINDWREEDGIEVDLTAPRLQPKVIELRFTTIRSLAHVSTFLREIANFESPITLSVPELGITREIRYVGCNRLKGEPAHIREFEVQFVEDLPMNGYTYAEPTASISGTDKYFIKRPNGTNKSLRDYNIIILEETDESLNKNEDVKSSLSIQTATANGQIYDYDGTVKYAASEATLKALMLTGTTADFNNKMNALLYDLTRPGERTLYRASDLVTFTFYYNKSRIKKVSPYKKTGIWCEMEIDIVLTKKPTQYDY